MKWDEIFLNPIIRRLRGHFWSEIPPENLKLDKFTKFVCASLHLRVKVVVKCQITRWLDQIRMVFPLWSKLVQNSIIRLLHLKFYPNFDPNIFEMESQI